MLGALLGLTLLGAAPTPYEAARDGAPVMQAEVRAAGAERFEALLSLDEDAPVWIFLRSGLTREGGTSWRPQSLVVLTEGVELVRIGFHDALIATDGGDVPREVRLAVRPFTQLLNADYQPAIRLGDDSVALFSDHFSMRPAPSIHAVRALGTSWTSLPDYAGAHPLIWFSGSDFLSPDGERFAPPQGRYVVHGSIEDRGNDLLAAFVDPDLPDWLEEQMQREIPLILDFYAERLGPHEEEAPQLLVSWGGPSPDRVSLGGSVIGPQIVMQLEGASLLEPSRRAGGYARQFIAHEAAHFWLGNMVTYGLPGDAWTSEGGADLMALRAAAFVDPEGAATREARMLREALLDCPREAAGGPLSTAPDRGEQEAFYSCGFLLSLLAEEIADGDFFAFWSGLIASNREDATVSAQDWLDRYRGLGGSTATVSIIEEMLYARAPEPALLIRLFASAGIEFDMPMVRPS